MPLSTDIVYRGINIKVTDRKIFYFFYVLKIAVEFYLYSCFLQLKIIFNINILLCIYNYTFNSTWIYLLGNFKIIYVVIQRYMCMFFISIYTYVNYYIYKYVNDIYGVRKRITK